VRPKVDQRAGMNIPTGQYPFEKSFTCANEATSLRRSQK